MPAGSHLNLWHEALMKYSKDNNVPFTIPKRGTKAHDEALIIYCTLKHKAPTKGRGSKLAGEGFSLAGPSQLVPRQRKNI